MGEIHMLKKIDLSQEIAKDYSDTEQATIQGIIDCSPDDLKKGLQVFALHTDEDGNSNYGILVDTDIIDFEIATTEDTDGQHSFFKV
jgi:hypothetical protein